MKDMSKEKNPKHCTVGINCIHHRCVVHNEYCDYDDRPAKDRR